MEEEPPIQKPRGQSITLFSTKGSVGILSRAADLGYAFRFLKILTATWNKLKAYELGIVDANGKNIKKAMELYACEINIDDDGSCTILGTDQELLEQGLEYVKAFSIVPKVGETYTGEVVKILDFGAFVKIAPSIEGLVHISEVDWKRTENMFDALSEGDTVDVKIVKIDPATKKIGLSIKALKPKPEHKD